MPYRKNLKSRLCFTLCVSIALASLTVASLCAQTPWAPQSTAESNTAAAESPSAFINVDTSRDIGPNVAFSYDSSLAPKYNFGRILSAALGCELQDKRLSLNDYGMTEIEARCDFPLHRTWLQHAGEVDLRPLKDLLHGESGYVVGISLQMPGNDFVRCSPVPTEVSDKTSCVYLLKESSQTSRSIQFEFGYRRGRAMRVGFLLSFLLIVPTAATFWFRRRALTTPEDARPALSFAHSQFLRWTATLGIVSWWTAIDLLHADEYMAFVLPALKWADAFATDVFPWLLLWIPPVAVYFLCLLLSSPLQILRGTNHSQREILGRSFWAVARFAFPMSFLAVAVSITDHSPRIAFLILAVGIFSGGFAARQFARAHGLELHALTSGELRDRAFAMAQAAGTKLNQLYVLPMEHMRMANAFAHTAHNIYLTDYLVNNLSKREVDAILGHEIAHLQKKHIGRRMTIMFVGVLGMTFGIGFAEYWLPRGFPVGPIFMSLLLLLLYFTSRRNEFAADAGSVALTGDAEAMITGLAKISRLNVMPIHWGKVDEKLQTHPSTLGRIEQLARLGGVPEARIPELLRESAEPPAEVYSIPATSLSAGKIFSTKYKSRATQRLAWTAVSVASLIPGLIAYAAQWGRYESLFLWTTYVTGLVLTIAAEMLIANYFGRHGLPKLERPLREKAKSEGNVNANSGVFVSFAPDSAPRIYEGNWAWDLGILCVTTEEIVYWGEEARFALRRDEIVSVVIRAGSVSWSDNSSMFITWRDFAGRESTFNVRPLSAVSACVLAENLESWRRGEPLSQHSILAASQPIMEKLHAPNFGQVTSAPPRIFVRGRALVRDVMFNMFVALGVVFALGLFFPPLDLLADASGSAYTNPVGGAVYVLAVVLLARIFMLIPFWRVREEKIPDAAAAASSAPVA
jgi:Zn-dependent protease with chaperone function